MQMASSSDDDNNGALNLSSDEGPKENDIEIGGTELQVTNEIGISSENELFCCCICCSVDSCVIIECTDPINPHGMCLECFLGYAKSSFELGSEYERVRERDDGLVSSAGQLPCPYFINGACNCTCMDESLFRKILDDPTFELWRKADGRIQVSQYRKEQEEADEREAIAKERRSQLESLHHTAQEVLIKGCTVSCPRCNTKGEKDDKCIHIRCAICSTNWCYCCGRSRGSSNQCQCDTTSAYMESNPGWDNFAIDTESPGQGALHEFHRRRIMYLLRQLKESTDAHLWNELRVQYPDMLDNIPTIGRCIDWDSLDSAILPTFGRTQATGEDVLLNIDNPIDQLPANIQNEPPRLWNGLYRFAWCLMLISIILYFIVAPSISNDDTGELVNTIGVAGISVSIFICISPCLLVLLLLICTVLTIQVVGLVKWIWSAVVRGWNRFRSLFTAH